MEAIPKTVPIVPHFEQPVKHSCEHICPSALTPPKPSAPAPVKANIPVQPTMIPAQSSTIQQPPSAKLYSVAIYTPQQLFASDYYYQDLYELDLISTMDQFSLLISILKDSQLCHISQLINSDGKNLPSPIDGIIVQEKASISEGRICLSNAVFAICRPNADPGANDFSYHFSKDTQLKTSIPEGTLFRDEDNTVYISGKAKSNCPRRIVVPIGTSFQKQGEPPKLAKAPFEIILMREQSFILETDLSCHLQGKNTTLVIQKGSKITLIDRNVDRNAEKALLCPSG